MKPFTSLLLASLLATTLATAQTIPTAPIEIVPRADGYMPVSWHRIDDLEKYRVTLGGDTLFLDVGPIMPFTIKEMQQQLAVHGYRYVSRKWQAPARSDSSKAYRPTPPTLARVRSPDSCALYKELWQTSTKIIGVMERMRTNDTTLIAQLTDMVRSLVPVAETPFDSAAYHQAVMVIALTEPDSLTKENVVDYLSGGQKQYSEKIGVLVEIVMDVYRDKGSDEAQLPVLALNFFMKQADRYILKFTR